MAHRPARRAAGSRRIARQAAGEDQGHARARQFSSGILQAGSPETKYQLSAHDPEFGAFLRSISHLTNDDHRMAFAACRRRQGFGGQGFVETSATADSSSGE